MRVSVFGLGYVGCVTAACLASRGHHVLGVDINPDKVEVIIRGGSPIIERGLAELIRAGRVSGNLSATEDANEAVAFAEIILVCVGTPSNSNGNLNFKFIDRVCAEIAESLSKSDDYKVVAIRSTLLPGVIGERLLPLLAKGSGKQVGKDFGLASNPEFLREGSAIADFNDPPFTIVGTDDDWAGNLLEQLYEGVAAPVIRTDLNTASMIKYACNAFHGLKVVFANEIGQLCKRSGVDGRQVMDVLCQDTRLNISPRYLKPGFAFGGSCLPKDLRALLYLARHTDLQIPVLESILPSNRSTIQNVADMILADPKRKKVGIIGLTFKTGTDDLRESPMVELVEILIGKGLAVSIYDRNVVLSKLVGGNKVYIEQVLPHISAMIDESLEKVVSNADVVVVAHELHGSEEKELAALLMPGQLVIDLVKMESLRSLSCDYEGICW